MKTRNDTLLARVIAEREGRPHRAIEPHEEARATRMALALANPTSGLAKAVAWAEKAATALHPDVLRLNPEAAKELQGDPAAAAGKEILRAVQIETAHAEREALRRLPDPRPQLAALIGENGVSELERLAQHPGQPIGPVVAAVQRRIGPAADAAKDLVANFTRAQRRIAELDAVLATDADPESREVAAFEGQLKQAVTSAAEHIKQVEAREKAEALTRQAEEARKAAGITSQPTPRPAA